MLLRRHHELGWNCFGFNVMLRHPEILYQLFPQNFPGKYLGRVLGKIHLKKNLLQTLVESLCPCIFIESIRRECTQHNHLTQNLHSLPSLSSNRIRERVRVPTVEIAKSLVKKASSLRPLIYIRTGNESKCFFEKKIMGD